MNRAGRDPLDPGRILTAIREREPAAGRFEGPIHVFESVGSTNTALMALAREGAPEGTIVVADAQSAGRGRFNRGWHSAPGLGLWFSILLRPALAPEEVAPITILAGLAVREAVERTAGIPARIKWPNDIYVAGRKLAGLLAETATAVPTAASPGLPPPLILGIGVNVNHAATDFPDELRPRAISIRMASEAPDSRPFSRGDLLAAIVSALRERYARYLEAGLPVFIPEWNRNALWIGQPVVHAAPDGEHRGIVMGLDASGGLRIAGDGGKVDLVMAGEIAPAAPASPAPPAAPADSGAPPAASGAEPAPTDFARSPDGVLRAGGGNG